VAPTLAEFPGAVAEELLWKVRLLARGGWLLAIGSWLAIMHDSAKLFRKL